ncbi:uncharacterized protein LOC123556503 [Mercenaria mercenaria]|uniref:uncharacterized protein LOC123556503 n=1 Tax=Mercenaria mercenaria TaxID=6596 RepID=UPI00234E85E6|nr:uncharacterized protein LOC123556503 [Mercenaria mercenaria]
MDELLDEIDLDVFQDLGVFHRCIEKEKVRFFELAMNKGSNKLNICNGKGETALHIACKHPDVNAFTHRILGGISNVNAQNYWRQTPLHYAAAARSVGTIKVLLSQPGIDVNCMDVNGYTALHTFVISSKKFDGNWKEGMKILVEAKIDINAQTKYGQTILHLASLQDDNTEFLGYMLSKYQDIDFKAVNIAGENFLHIYSMTEIGHDCMSFFEKMRKINQPVLQKLLSQQDVSGSTPWCLMVENGELTSEHFKRMIEVYGVSVHGSDNLGNTALHRRVGKGGVLSEHNLEICSLMVQKGIDINCLNVFGQSAGSVIFYEEVCNFLLHNKLDLMIPDRWGRTPVFYMLNQSTNPRVIEAMSRTCRLTENTKDAYMATPLHYAAYGGLEEHMQVLLKHGADLNPKDSLGDTPLDTARRHGNRNCWKLLASAMRLPTADKVDFLYKSQGVTLNLSSLYKGQPLDKLLAGFPKDIEMFAERALESKYKAGKTLDNYSDVSDIVSAVNQHVRSVCQIVSGYDSRFRISVFPTGSSAEGTKVGPPDEFDFVLCIESLGETCDIETSEFANPGYAKLRFRDNPVHDEYMSFSDTDRYFLALPFLHYLFRYIRRALNETQLWKDGNLYTRSEETIRVLYKKPVFNYDLYWVGAHNKNMKISIDLVPAVYQRGWWPRHTKFDHMKLMHDTVNAAGCFVLMQTEENSFSQGWYRMNDSINLTCNSSNRDDKHRLLQISVAPAEIAIMKSLPEIYRQAYALAKIAKSADICPDVQIDIEPPVIDNSIYKNIRKQSVSPPKEIKSYWLKNCIFYLADDFRGAHMCGNTTPLEIARLAYQKLLDFALSWNFRPYVLHKYDLFDFEPGNSYFDVFIIRRKVCIEMVLAILGKRLPQNFMDWIKICERNYYYAHVAKTPVTRTLRAPYE